MKSPATQPPKAAAREQTARTSEKTAGRAVFAKRDDNSSTRLLCRVAGAAGAAGELWTVGAHHSPHAEGVCERLLSLPPFFLQTRFSDARMTDHGSAPTPADRRPTALSSLIAVSLYGTPPMAVRRCTLYWRGFDSYAECRVTTGEDLVLHRAGHCMGRFDDDHEAFPRRAGRGRLSRAVPWRTAGGGGGSHPVARR